MAPRRSLRKKTPSARLSGVYSTAVDEGSNDASRVIDQALARTHPDGSQTRPVNEVILVNNGLIENEQDKRPPNARSRHPPVTRSDDVQNDANGTLEAVVTVDASPPSRRRAGRAIAATTARKPAARKRIRTEGSASVGQGHDESLQEENKRLRTTVEELSEEVEKLNGLVEGLNDKIEHLKEALVMTAKSI